MHAVPSSNIQIQPFTPQYQQGVVDVILPIQREEFGFSVTVQDQPDLLEIPSFYQKGKGNFWIALSGGSVVGTIAILDIGNDQGALRKMFVHPHHRGKEKAVARELLATLQNWCRKSGIKEIYLGTTSKFLAAHRFYAKNNYVEVSKEALPPDCPYMSIDTNFFKKVL